MTNPLLRRSTDVEHTLTMAMDQAPATVALGRDGDKRVTAEHPVESVDGHRADRLSRGHSHEQRS